MSVSTSPRESYVNDRRTLHELPGREGAASDLRQQIEDHPLAFIGLAIGGGVVLASIAAGYYRRNRPASGGVIVESPKIRKTSPTFDKASAAWENIKGALLGLAVTRFRDYADEFLPGFSEHFQKAAAERRNS